MNALRTIRNNWKKSVFGLGVASYGVYSVYNYLETSKHMRRICQRVLLMQNDGSLPKRVVVILNASANKRKAESMFQKYCEPLLHLNGCLVEIIKTNYSGHAKSIVENMKVLPDVLVVAGGDGTSSEVVTGLLRRTDKPCPILMLPLGRKNETVWENLEKAPNNKLEYIKTLSECILPMVQGKLSSKSVIKFDVIENDDDSTNTGGDATKAKPIFGLNRFSWGVLRDIESMKDKYWLFGILRHHAAAFFNSFSSDFNWKFATELEYTPPCPGCQNCAIEEKRIQSGSYLGSLLTGKVNYKSNQPILMKNENCSLKEKCRIETNQLNIACKNNPETFSELQTSSIDSLNRGFDFIKNVPRVASGKIEPSLILRSRTIYLNPDSESATKGFFSIDGEEYDIRPLKISLVPNAIKMYN